MLAFDELNRLSRELPERSIPIDRYFDEMNLPVGEKEDRKEFARKLEDELFEIMVLIYTVIEQQTLGNIPAVTARLEETIKDLVSEYTVPDSEMLSYINQYSTNFVDTTVKHLQTAAEGEEEKAAYYVSEDRARYNAENEANTIFNYEQFRQAKADGFTRKQWITMKDERVRRTHAKIDGTTIPIDGFFQVGDYLMRFPKDWDNGGPEECVNCRCTLRFL